MPGALRTSLGLLCAVQFMLVLDASIVAVALPSLRSGLGMADRHLQYTISLYALAFGGLLVLGGRVADLLGRRRVLIAGIGLFGLASAGCGLAASPEALLAGRACQGIGAAFASPAALSLLLDIFTTDEQRSTALGAWGGVSASGGAAGLVLGGVLTDTVGWRWVFLVNVPICLFAASLAPRWLPEVRGPRLPLDGLGGALVTAGLAALTFGLTEIESHGLASVRSGGALLVALALLVAFGARQATARVPLVALDLFATPGLVAANVAAAVVAALIAAQNFFGSLALQRVFGLSALETGFAILPVTLLALLGSAAAGAVERRVGRRATLAGGLATMAVGLALLSRVSSEGTAWQVVPGFAWFGLGLGLAFVAVTEAATDGVPADRRGLASGVVNTSNQLGFAIGIAAFSALAVAATPGAGGSGALLDGYRAAFLAAAILGGLAAFFVIPALPLRSATPGGRDEH